MGVADKTIEVTIYSETLDKLDAFAASRQMGRNQAIQNLLAEGLDSYESMDQFDADIDVIVSATPEEFAEARATLPNASFQAGENYKEALRNTVTSAFDVLEPNHPVDKLRDADLPKLFRGLDDVANDLLERHTVRPGDATI